MGAEARSVIAGAAFVATSLLATGASAYCRTTTCDPETETCVADATGCITTGLPLFWPERDIHFGTQKDGSPLRDITYEDANAAISEAYRTWRSVDCDGEPPSFEVWDLGAPFDGIECDEPEFNQNEPNANVWMFRDESWPYTGASSTLALTTITFEVPTGEILDADVEVNTFNIDISVGDGSVENDLLSIATHEAGHFFGLSHTNIEVATMFRNYQPGDIEFRTLHPDDIAGLCAIYPPDRDAPEGTGPRPRHGFSRFCAEPTEPRGCSVPTTAPEADQQGRGAGLVALLAGGVAIALRRRRRGR